MSQRLRRPGGAGLTGCLRLLALAASAAAFLLVPAAAASANPLAHIVFAGSGSGKVVGIEPAPGKPKIECEWNGATETKSGTCDAETITVGTFIAIDVEHEAAFGSKFTGWKVEKGIAAGCEQDEPAAGECSVITLKSEIIIKATFELSGPPSLALTINEPGAGAGQVNCEVGGGPTVDEPCASSYPEGTELKLIAAADEGSVFEGFENGTGSASACTGTGPCTITLTAGSALDAPFDLIPRTLTINEPGSGTGTVECKFNGGSAGPCTSPQPNGTGVEVIATASGGSELAGLTGTNSAAGCTASPCTFTIEADSSVTATFTATALPEFPLTVTKTGSGSGEVTSSPAGIACGGDCEEEYEEGTPVTLTATAAGGSVFTGWSGSGCSGTGSCEVTMSEAKAVSANFAPAFTLTVTKEGEGSGTVVSSPAGIECGATCSAAFEESTEVTLTASPAANSAFTSWKGCGTVEGRKCKVTMSAAKEVKAKFSPTYAVTVKKTTGNTGLGGVSGVTCDANCSSATAAFVVGKTATLKPKASKGSAFTEWSSCPGTVEGSNCVMTSAGTAEAKFTAIPKFSLTVNKTGSGQGTVKSKPSSISCGLTCSTQTSSFQESTEVELTASVTLGKGSEFGGWSLASPGGGNCTGLTNPCKMPAILGTQSVTAKFE